MSKYAEDLQYEKYEIEEKKNKEPVEGVNNYKILPLKNLKKEEVGEEDFDILPNIPFLAYCIGAVKSGKSLFMANLFFNPNFPYKNTFDVKILISNTAYNDKIMKPIIEQFDFVFTDYNDALLEEIISMVESDDSDCKYLLVLEDIIGNVLVAILSPISFLSTSIFPGAIASSLETGTPTALVAVLLLLEL